MSLPKIETSVFEAILARRSVRSYKARKVDRSTVNILLEAAVRAPTAIHQEPWAFIIIQDKPLLKNLSDRAKPLFLVEARESGLERSGHSFDIFDYPDFNIFYDAGTLVLICGKTTSPSFVADCWLAAENLMLAACAMGLGTCVIGSALPIFNIPEIKLQLNIPEIFSVVAPIIVGYPDDEIEPVSRKPPIVLESIPAAATS